MKKKLAAAKNNHRKKKPGSIGEVLEEYNQRAKYTNSLISPKISESEIRKIIEGEITKSVSSSVRKIVNDTLKDIIPHFLQVSVEATLESMMKKLTADEAIYFEYIYKSMKGMAAAFHKERTRVYKERDEWRQSQEKKK